MKSKPQTNKADRTTMDLGQKEAEMEKLGKDKMDHMGSGEEPKPAAEKPKHGTDGGLAN